MQKCAGAATVIALSSFKVAVARFQDGEAFRIEGEPEVLDWRPWPTQGSR